MSKEKANEILDNVMSSSPYRGAFKLTRPFIIEAMLSYGRYKIGVKLAEKTDKEILEYYGWTEECSSPYELRNIDGSFATKQAAIILMQSLREEYLLEIEES